MSGKFYFGDNGNVPLCCVSNDFFDLFLCVEAPMYASIGIPAYRANLGETGIFFYFYGPQMVVGQVPMEIIHFEHGHDVELFFYKFHVVEVATYVEHHTSVSIGGFIFDFHTRDFPCYVIDNRFALDLGRKQLHNRLHAIKDSLRSFGFDNYLFGGDCQLVAFVPYF